VGRGRGGTQLTQTDQRARGVRCGGGLSSSRRAKSASRHDGGPLFSFPSLSTFSRSSSQAGYEAGPTASTIRVRPSTPTNVRPRITGPTRSLSPSLSLSLARARALSRSLQLLHVRLDSPAPLVYLLIYSSRLPLSPRTGNGGGKV